MRTTIFFWRMRSEARALSRMPDAPNGESGIRLFFLPGYRCVYHVLSVLLSACRIRLRWSDTRVQTGLSSIPVALALRTTELDVIERTRVHSNFAPRTYSQR